MDIRIAFFDIDGTLVPFGEQGVRPRVRSALERLRENGVKLFICTGRAPFNLAPLEGIGYDGCIAYNGSYAWDASGVLHENCLREEDIRAVVRNARELGLPVIVSTLDRFGANFFQQALDEYMGFSKHGCDVLAEDAYEELIRGRVFQLMVGTRREQDEALVRGVPGVKAARWWDMAVDIVPAGSSKSDGMARVLEKLGLVREQSIAFGDGGNDADMLEYAGIGIAMGNAEPSVRASADLIAPPCEEDGVISVLEDLGLI
ncbi:MAG: Cof-type HAD-IIB family hydrolase [Clostridia bacterium]|nr:Cof-type HAD-IIB family hydrolase [Clostridia bacterium]